MKGRSEDGQIMLEAVFCILATIFVLAFVFALGFVFYQHTLVAIVANEVAEEVSQTYKLENVSDSTNISAYDVRASDGSKGIGKYRYYFFASVYRDKATDLANDLMQQHLGYTSLADDVGDMIVEIEVVKDDVGRRHYAVTVRQKYQFMLGGILKLFGLWEEKEISATAYVMGVDVLHHVNAVKNGEYMIDELAEDVTVVKSFNSLIKFANNIMKLFVDDD